MSLRAYFAGQAMAAYNSSSHELAHRPSAERAQWAVEDADALIAELNKPTGGEK